MISSDPDMNVLRKKMLSIKEDLKRRALLEEKRIELENHCLRLKTQLEKQLLKAYEAESRIKDEAQALFTQAEELKKELDASNLQLKKIDQNLDRLEDLDDKHLIEVRNNLIQALLKAFPEELPNYENLCREMSHFQAIESENNTLLKFHCRIIHLLEIIKEVRAAIKRRWILSYLFGANPNIQITQSIQAILSLIEMDTPKLLDIQHHSRDEQTKALASDSLKLAAQLKIDSQKRWSYRHIDKHLLQDLGEFHNLAKLIETRTIEIKEARLALELDLEKWLNRV